MTGMGYFLVISSLNKWIKGLEMIQSLALVLGGCFYKYRKCIKGNLNGKRNSSKIEKKNTSISWREGRNISKSNSLVPSE